MTPDESQLPRLPQVLARLQQRPVEVHSLISLGAGRGGDLSAFLPVWPEMSVLLVDMDPRFVAAYQALQARYPKLRYEICGAAAEDRVGYQRKSDQFGGAILSERPASLEGVTETPFKRLDTLVREHALPGPYFLKFDTHGVEL